MAKAAEIDINKELKRAATAYTKGRFYEVESILYKIIWTMPMGPDEHIQARALLGNALRKMGRTAEAEKELRKALEIATAEGKASTKRELMLSLGKIHFRKGDLDLATEFLKDAHDAAEDAGDALLQGKALIDMGNVQILLGNYTIAETRFQEGVKLIEHKGTKVELMRGLHNLAYVHFNLGELVKARDVLIKCMSLCADADEVGMCLYVLSDLAHTYIRLGELDKAQDLLKKAGVFLDKTDDRLGRLNLRWVQGLLMDARGDSKGAIEVYEDVARSMEEVGAQVNIVELALDFVPVFLKAGNIKEAQMALDRAKGIVKDRSIGHFNKRIAESEGLISEKGARKI